MESAAAAVTQPEARGTVNIPTIGRRWVGGGNGGEFDAAMCVRRRRKRQFCALRNININMLLHWLLGALCFVGFGHTDFQTSSTEIYFIADLHVDCVYVLL